MRILLIGEYSNVHWTLAEGLRKLGHSVVVLSNGDFWKDYPRDISLVRHNGKLGGAAYIAKLLMLLPKLRGYDIVQLINPMFLELKAERIFAIYKYLRRHNKCVILGGYGMDYYWVSTCCNDKPLKYSDFNIGDKLRTNADAMKERRDWLATAKEHLNKMIANDCDYIITGLYEYYVCYEKHFPEKTCFIPFPIVCKPTEVSTNSDIIESVSKPTPKKTKIFIGINRTRSEYKGTDIMLKAAKDLESRHKNSMELVVAESVPFKQYCEMMNSSDAILDQLYSYTPAMNALEAMSKGIVCIGGGEEENYEILHEDSLRPIINVAPTYESVYTQLEDAINHPSQLRQKQADSIRYIKKHHDYIKVAKQYEYIYNKVLKTT